MMARARPEGVMQLHTMFKHFRAAALVSLAVVVASGRMSAAQDAAVSPPPNALPDVLPSSSTDPEGVETLTRGPVHEAFAAPTASDPKPNALIAKKPPVEIDEVQPDFRPEGAIWINGYWEWDPEVEDFIWISGLWRVPPPEMRWVPPYWTEVEGGWQRVSGFWVSTSAGELEYRQVPPNSLEVGPSSLQPADNYFYIPGTWSYYDTGYRWRSGYWSPYREDFVWCPARWIWTPAGCLYQSGYWDHRPLFRAQYFAPVRFTSAVYLTPGYRYRPWCVVDSSRFFVHLWIGPRANCYHFGNYYGSYASRFGYTPWCNWNYRSRQCYDPLWSWCNTHYRRQGIDYIGRCRGWHDHFDSHEHERPARTWNDQVRLIADAKLDPRKSQRVVAADLADVVKRDDLPIRLTKLNARERESIVKVSDDMRKLNVERLKIEREGRVARVRDDGDKPGIDKLGGDKPGDGQSDGDKPNGGRSGRGPRIDLAKPSVDLKPGDIKPGDDKPGNDKPSGDSLVGDKAKTDKPDASKVTRRVDELSKQLSSGGEAKKTTKLKLPEQTDAIREVTRNSRTTARNRDNSAGQGLKETTINLPGKTEGRPRINADRGNTTVRSSTGGESGGSETGGSESTGNKPSNSNGGNRGRSVIRSGGGNSSGSNSGGNTAASSPSGPELKPPKIDLPAGSGNSSSSSGGNQAGDGSRSRRSSDGPKIELPKNSSAPSDAPKIESRSRESRSSQPRMETPKFDAPKIEAPKIESRSNRSGESSIRSSQPRINLPMSSSGIGSGSDGPKIEARSIRSNGGESSRAMSRQSGGAPSRIEAPKFSAPKVESAPRAAPRIEMSRSSESRSNQSRSMSRSESSRISGSGNGGGNSGSGGGSNRSRGRDRD